LKIRPNACRHLKNLCKLGLRPKFGLRTKSDLFYQVTQIVITGSALWLHCSKASAKINRKIESFILHINYCYSVTQSTTVCVADIVRCLSDSGHGIAT